MLVFVLVSLLYGLSSFVIILTRCRELVALLLLSFGCLVTVNALYPFMALPRVGLQFVIVVCLDHTHLLFYHILLYCRIKFKLTETPYVISFS